MDNSKPDEQEVIADVATLITRSRRLIIWILAGLSVLLVAALVSLAIFAGALLSAKSDIKKAQQILATDQAELSQVLTAQRDEVNRVRDGLCSEQQVISTAPLSPQTTKLGVLILESFRRAFVVLQCPGKIPPPPKELITKGKQYHIDIRY